MNIVKIRYNKECYKNETETKTIKIEKKNANYELKIY